MLKFPIYLDHNATTPLAPAAFDRMAAILREEFGNPSSVHHFGQRAKALIDDARSSVARLLNADPSEIVFTGSGTEGDNLALRGAAEVHEQTLEEARASHKVLGVAESIFLDNPALALGELGAAELNKILTGHVEAVTPDILLIPYLDRHIDHRLVFDACMVAARPINAARRIKLVAAYETISSTH